MKPATGDVNSLHRGAKILVDLGIAKSWDEAYERLSRYRFNVVAGADAVTSAAGQTALLTIVNCGIRCCPGGVFVHGIPEDQKNLTLLGEGDTLRVAVVTLGGTAVSEHPKDVSCPTLVIGNAGAEAGSCVLRVTWGRWCAGVLPEEEDIRLTEDGVFPPAAVLSGALGVSEAFASLMGTDRNAGRRAVGIDLRDPGSGWMHCSSKPLALYLPKSLWLLGLGHLGQAYAWVAAALPYPDQERPTFMLQDVDIVKDANLSTSVLSFTNDLGQLKTRVVSSWLERRGFYTSLLEHPFAGDLKVAATEPRILLAGVDNLAARRLLETPGCDLVIDVGLGAVASDYDGICLQTFTNTGRAASAFHEPKRSAPIRAQSKNEAAYKALGLDTCGMHLASDAAVGVPFVGVSAACFAIAEVCRAIEGKSLIDTAALSLSTLPEVDLIVSGTRCRNPGYVRA